MRNHSTPRYSFAQPDFGDSFIPLELGHSFGTAPEHAGVAPTGDFKDAVDYERSFDWGATAWSDLPTGDDASNILSVVRDMPTGVADAAVAVAPKAQASAAVAQALGTYKGAMVFDFSFDHTGNDRRGDGVLHGAYGSSNTALDASAPAPFETLSLAQMLTQILLNSGTNTAATDKPINWPDFTQALTVFSGYAIHASPN